MTTKTIALISGGLDSLLAAKVVQEQGVEVQGIAFVMSAASTDIEKTADSIRDAAEDAGIRVRVIDISKEFLSVLGKPRHGYGGNINPCIDCKIFMLKRAKEIMEDEGASFIITGEVLGERPMSQNRKSLDLIQEQSGVGEYLLRPLSAKLMEETVPEKEGLVDREKLLDIQGRSRKPQLALATHYGIKKFSALGVSCLLTDPLFSAKVKDLMKAGLLDLHNISLLKFGRHFRLAPGTKVIVGRDEKENEALEAHKKDNETALWMEKDPGPYVLLQGAQTPENIAKAASLAVGHSKRKKDKGIEVQLLEVGKEVRTILADPLGENDIEQLRI